jgi:hypothetical protein
MPLWLTVVISVTVVVVGMGFVTWLLNTLNTGD